MMRCLSVLALCVFYLSGCTQETTIGGSHTAATAVNSNEFIRPFLIYYGGGPSLLDADMERLAKFDLLAIDRFRYNNMGFKNLRDSGLSLSDLNSVVEIFLYQMGPEVSNYNDDKKVIGLNNIARYEVSRDHGMGSLNINHPELFLLDNIGERSYNVGYSDPGQNEFMYLMDIGSQKYIDYWLESTETDIINQAWVADGILVDNCGVFRRPQPANYDDSTWSTTMNQFVQALVAGLESSGQKMWANRGQTSSEGGFADWLALDQSGNAPSVVMEEGAFAVSWGDTSDTQFPPENRWKRTVDLLGMIENSRIAYLSHTDLDEAEVGVDNFGKPVTFWQSMYYALGSYLLGKNDLLNNAYFMFVGWSSGYSKIWWYDEYEKIDFGRAMGNYQILDMSGDNIYWREFESGYVYVNPTKNDVNRVVLPQLGKIITHENLFDPLSSIPIVSSFNIPSHHAVFVHKL